MDNGFEKSFPQRAERDEYRSRFRFEDEDTQRETQRSKKTKNKTDRLVRLLLLQTALCAAVAAAVLLTSRLSPAVYERMKGDYSGIMNKNMTVGQVWEQIKNAASFAIKPVEEQGEAAETPTEPAEETATEAVAASTGVDTGLTVFEAVSDETGETVAVGEMESGSGGGDIGSGEAAKGTSFAPYYVSVSPVMPVKGARITSRFGYRTNPISGRYGFHTGLDLAVAEGAPAAAAFYGEIEETGENEVWGKYVLMRHSEQLETYYCHLSEIYVTEGSVIRQGETVGLVGSTGWSTGPHLHFEVRIGGVRVDPERLLYPDGADES